MKIRALADRLVVKRVEQEENSRGASLIPDSAREKPVEGPTMLPATAGYPKVGKRGRRPSKREIAFCLISTREPK
jgi:chaperonin GroES